MLATILSIATGLSATVMRVVPFAGFLFNPLWTAAKFVFNLAGNPLGRIILIVALAVGAYAVGDVRGRLHEHKIMETKLTQMQEQAKKEAADEIAKAEAASKAAQQKFDAGRDSPRPSRGVSRWMHHNADPWARD